MSNKSRSLDVVSNDRNKEDRPGVERRRVPRLSLTTEQFRLSQTGRIFPVADLSVNGMALRIIDRGELAIFPMGMRFEGVLNLRREKYSVKAQVRHLGTELVGCEFEGLDEKACQAIRAFLDPAILGKELKPIPAADGVALWYHGPSGTDLLFWRLADGQYSRIILFVLGSYIQWENGAGLSTGRMMASFEQSEIRGVVRLETMLLEADPKPDKGKLRIGQTLVSNSNIPQDLKKWCGRHMMPAAEEGA